MTAREGILEAVFALLQAVPGARAYRSRQAPADRAEGPVIVLEPQEEAVELRGAGGASAGVSVRNFTFLVTVLTRGAVPDQMADPIIDAIHTAVMADRTLGGLCALILEESTKWNLEVADGTAMAAEMQFTVRYQTSASSLST